MYLSALIIPKPKILQFLISTNNSLLHICGTILFDAKNYSVINTRKYYV